MSEYIVVLSKKFRVYDKTDPPAGGELSEANL